MFPSDFDGVLVGAPAWNWANLSAWEIHVNSFVANTTSPGYIPPTQFTFVFEQVTSACDLLDKVPDGVISNPRICNFQPASLLCQNFPAGTTGCFTQPQVDTLTNIYEDYIEDGVFIFPAFEKGSESMWTQTVTGFIWPLIADFFAVQVLNVSPTTFNPFSVDLGVVSLADQINPGGVIAADADLRPFFARNGKVIHYHGWADGLISSRSSVDYYNHVVKAVQQDFSNNYRLFMIPGMNHCAGGPGPWVFNTDAAGVALDQTADLVDQLLSWVEAGIAPKTLLGTKYVNDTGTQGIAFQRPICPYPTEAVWNGHGMWESPQNWNCEPIPAIVE
jgi:feruloyl esterase